MFLCDCGILLTLKLDFALIYIEVEDLLPVLEGLAKVCIVYWRASEASETLSGVYKFELVWYMYGGTYAITVAHATYT